jgi:hypothetical protein
MRFGHGIIIVLMAINLGFVSDAPAAQPRPWLCRDKPVFSSDQPMTYQAVKRGTGRWLMTFMRYDPSGLGHDGFTVFSAQEVGTAAEGNLAPGQWYAVALYRAGGHWICPANARESELRSPGVVSSVCFGQEPDQCILRLTVRSRSRRGQP